MCVDFTDLNKACLKDHYLFSSIDKLVDSISHHAVVFFLDAISGYHQIRIDAEDAEKTAFITNAGVFCYKVIPFGLKNARATSQMLVSGIFKDVIGSTVEVYVDDMVLNHPSDI